MQSPTDRARGPVRPFALGSFVRAGDRTVHGTQYPERSAKLPPVTLVGREPELAQIREFLAGAGTRTLVLTGGPGIGKTALWEAGIDVARRLGLRAADWATVTRLLDEWAESADEELLVTPTYQRCRALVAAGRGLAGEAREWATPALEASEPLGFRWQVLESRRALGVAALRAHEPAVAAGHLRAVWDHTRRAGVDEPGAFPVAPELVAALVELGERGEAQAVTDRLRDLAEAQEHPWGLASAKRCAAVIQLASGDESAAGALAQAAAAYEELGLRADAAHSLLALGRAQRRLKKWGAARESLERAAAGFEAIDSPGWAEEARSELARVGARRPTPSGELTPAERRVVELAADGSSNKEIALALFVSVRTVETHLTHAYAKLGVRSRAQLARRLSEPV